MPMNIKTILLTAFSCLAIAGTVTFTACVKDSCSDLKCQNGGSCSNGFCNCQTGYEGAECELKSADKFVGSFPGHLHCDGFPSVADTMDIVLAAEPDMVTVTRRGPMGGGAGIAINGQVVGNEIIVPDVYAGSSRRRISILIDPTIEKLTFTDEFKSDTADLATTSNCTFYGFK